MFSLEKHRKFSELVERERYAHTAKDVLKKSHELKRLFCHASSYPSLRRLLEKRNSYLKNVKGLNILDIGCGRGEMSLSLLKYGAYVTGIDISSVYVEEARKAALNRGFPSSQFNFLVMDIHQLDFDDNSFDLLLGDGILHHLDIAKSFQEIYRVLKPDGRAIFREPLADNPLLKIFRLLTPHARTVDEKPLSNKELNAISASPLWSAENLYCGIITAPVAVFTSIFLRPYPNNCLIQWADTIEQKFMRYGSLKSMNQYVLLNLKKLI